jgi:CBS domain-containing protein
VVPVDSRDARAGSEVNPHGNGAETAEREAGSTTGNRLPARAGPVSVMLAFGLRREYDHPHSHEVKPMQFSETINSVLERKGTGLFSIAPHISVFDAVQEMADKDVGALAVLSGQRLLGVFSERDYARKIILLGKASRETRVEEVMSSPVTVVTPDDTIDNCLRMMTNFRVRHLVVVDGDRPIGMISIGDLVNWIISAQVEVIDHLHSYISGRYPA